MRPQRVYDLPRAGVLVVFTALSVAGNWMVFDTGSTLLAQWIAPTWAWVVFVSVWIVGSWFLGLTTGAVVIWVWTGQWRSVREANRRFFRIMVGRDRGED